MGSFTAWGAPLQPVLPGPSQARRARPSRHAQCHPVQHFKPRAALILPSHKFQEEECVLDEYYYNMQRAFFSSPSLSSKQLCKIGMISNMPSIHMRILRLQALDLVSSVSVSGSSLLTKAAETGFMPSRLSRGLFL